MLEFSGHQSDTFSKIWNGVFVGLRLGGILEVVFNF